MRNMLTIFLVACWTASTLAVYSDFGGGSSWGGFRTGTVSKRDDDNGTKDIASAITDLLIKAKAGIKADDLKSRVDDIKGKANAYLTGKNSKVRAEEILNLVKDVAKSFDQDIALSAVIGGELFFEGKKVSVGFSLLNYLVKKLSAGDDNTDVIIASVAFIAESIGRSVTNVEELYKDDSGSNEKRGWGFNAGVNYGAGGWSVGAGISYTWG